MTQKESILQAFTAHGNKLTLRFILEHTWGYEFRARFTDLRHEGYRIEFTRGATPGENLYTLVPKGPVQTKAVTFGFERNGQGAFA